MSEIRLDQEIKILILGKVNMRNPKRFWSIDGPANGEASRVHPQQTDTRIHTLSVPN